MFLIEQIIKNEDNVSEKEDKCSDLFYEGCIKHLFVSFDWKIMVKTKLSSHLPKNKILQLSQCWFCIDQLDCIW